jgi:predicted phage terminase large subunit-like protein
MRVYGGSDYAVTADGGDYTVHISIGVDPEGNPYLLDLWRKQASSDVWIDAFCDMVLRWKPLEWAEETGQIKASLGPFIDRRQRERKAYVKRTQFPTRGDKSIRAQSIRGLMAVRGLRVNYKSPWFADFRSELLSFPAGKHDDQVDAIGLIGQLLDKIIAGSKPRPNEKPQTDRWERAFNRADNGSTNWKTL